MTPPLISPFPISGRTVLQIADAFPNMKRKLLLSVSSLLHPLIYKSIFGEFDEILQKAPSERDPETVRYYAKLCSEWYQILASYLEKTPYEIRKKLPFPERLLWNRIGSRYLDEICWYAECFADILNPDEEVRGKIGVIDDMMREVAE